MFPDEIEQVPQFFVTHFFPVKTVETSDGGCFSFAETSVGRNGFRRVTDEESVGHGGSGREEEVGRDESRVVGSSRFRREGRGDGALGL